MNMLTRLTPVTLGAALGNAPDQCVIANLDGAQWTVIWLDPTGRMVAATGSAGGAGWTNARPVLADDPADGFSTLTLSGDARTGWRLTAGKPGVTKSWQREPGTGSWVPLSESPTAAAVVAPPGLPAVTLAWTEAGDGKLVARSGRRVPGTKPSFPSAGLVLAVEQAGAWRDLGFADEVPDIEVNSVALAANGSHVLAAYAIQEKNGGNICRLVQLPLKSPAVSSPTWRELPAFPQAPGMAGPMSGQHNGAVLVAGGTNWPEPGKRMWYDAIHVLVAGEKTWRTGGWLPTPRAYGAAVSLPDGVLVMGGDSGDAVEQICQDAFFMTWDGDQVSVRPAPSLPVAVTNPMAVVLDGSVYLAGGNAGSPRLSRSDFWRLDLAKPAAGWQPLPTWPGPARSHAVMAALDGAIYLLSGLETRLNSEDKPQATYLADAYRYRPGQAWEKLPDLPWSAIAAPSPAPVTSKPARVFVLGGVDGRQAGLLPRATRVPEDIIYFDVAGHAWRLWREAWAGPMVTIPAVAVGAEWFFVTGEPMGGVRSTEAWAWQIKSPPVVP